MNVLSMFSGIGGLELGLERAGMTTVGQVEIDEYCRRVLAKHWPHVPRHDDVRTTVEWWQSKERPTVDVICGGFPCQDISSAGRRAGIIDGARSSLWSYLAGTVRVLRPRYVLVENVSALLVRGLDVVAADLAEIGYDLRWDCVPAAAVGAPHRRDRWFGIAYPPGERRRQGRSGRSADDGSSRNRLASWAQTWPQALADTESIGWGGGVVSRPDVVIDGPESAHGDAGTRRNAEWWAAEPDVGRVAHGIPHRVDRLRALGNAVVPQVAEHVGRLIIDHSQATPA